VRSLLSGGGWSLLLAWVTLTCHQWVLRQARLLILADKAKYDKVWAQILSHEINVTQLQSLKILTQQMQSKILAPASCRQYNRKLDVHGPWTSNGLMADAQLSTPRSSTRESSTRGNSRPSSILDHWQQDGLGSEAHEALLGCGIPGTLDQRNPVASLDQLYFQATAIHPILVAKVQAWAGMSRGYFQAAGSQEMQLGREIRDPGSFVLWEQVRDQELLQPGRIKWCSVKSVQRSLEKSTRSYGKVCGLTALSPHFLAPLFGSYCA
jgi:hypothetical protein